MIPFPIQLNQTVTQIFIKSGFYFYFFVEVSNISSVINDNPSSQPEATTNESSTSLNVQQTIVPASTPVSTTSNISSVASGSTTQSMQLNDAFAYLDRVRAEFADQPEIYNKFLQVMREFKSNR